ncbi:MAG: carbohydrate kinase family protein [Patescibacteria group bacterium]
MILLFESIGDIIEPKVFKFLNLMFDVITIGTATRDVFLTSKLFKVLKDPAHLKKIGFPTGEAECFALGSKLELEKPVFTIGGGAANAAVTFKRQGFGTAAVIKIGDDGAGADILKILKEEKVQVFPITDKKLGTAYSTILLTPDGERTILVYRGASEKISRSEITASKLKAASAYIVPGHIDFATVEWLVTTLKKNGALVAMNPSKFYIEMGPHKLKPILENLDIVILNREEAAYLTGIDYSKTRKIFKKFDEMINGIAIMTDGGRGAYASDGKYIYRAGIFKEKKLVDRTGAGDAFGSGFVAGLMQKKDIHYALRLASANATSVVEDVGAQEGILEKKDFKNKRWNYLDLDIEPL